MYFKHFCLPSIHFQLVFSIRLFVYVIQLIILMDSITEIIQDILILIQQTRKSSFINRLLWSVDFSRNITLLTLTIERDSHDLWIFNKIIP